MKLAQSKWIKVKIIGGKRTVTYDKNGIEPSFLLNLNTFFKNSVLIRISLFYCLGLISGYPWVLRGNSCIIPSLNDICPFNFLSIFSKKES